MSLQKIAVLGLGKVGTLAAKLLHQFTHRGCLDAHQHGRLMRKHDRPVDPLNARALPQEILQLVRRRIDLGARTTSALVLDWHIPFDKVAVLVVLVTPPGITDAGYLAIEVLG